MKTTNQMTGTRLGGEGRASRVFCEPDTGNGGGAATPPDNADAKAAALIADAVAKAMAPFQKQVSDSIAALKGTRSTANTAGMPGVDAPATPATEPTPVTSEQRRVKLPEGISAARVMKAQMLAKLRGGGLTAESVLKGWGYHEEAKAAGKAVEKALSMNVFADGGALVPVEYSTEIIQLLRNKTCVRTLGARTLPMGASLELPAQLSAANAYYVGEGSAVTPSQPSLGGIRFTEKKLMALVPLSNDLIANASLDAEAFVRDDLVQVLALKEDYQSIFGVGGENSPRGIIALTSTANVYAATAVDPKAPTLAEVKKELAKAKRILKAGNIPMVSLGWIMSPRTEEYLYGITDGNGNSVFQAALDAGNLHGAPVVVTNQIPENLDGTSDASRILFGDFSQFIIGESAALAVEAFPNATYDSTGAGNLVSGISNDQSVLRAKAKHDFNMRYPGAFVVVKNRWGAA